MVNFSPSLLKLQSPTLSTGPPQPAIHDGVRRRGNGAGAARTAAASKTQTTKVPNRYISPSFPESPTSKPWRFAGTNACRVDQGLRSTSIQQSKDGGRCPV